MSSVFFAMTKAIIMTDSIPIVLFNHYLRLGPVEQGLTPSERYLPTRPPRLPAACEGHSLGGRLIMIRDVLGILVLCRHSLAILTFQPVSGDPTAQDQYSSYLLRFAIGECINSSALLNLTCQNMLVPFCLPHFFYVWCKEMNLKYPKKAYKVTGLGLQLHVKLLISLY